MKNLLPALFVILITIISCNPSEPENNWELSLKLEDVSCVEAWLNIRTNNISLPSKLNVTANSKLVNQFILTSNDSLIVIDSLLPNTSYIFQASTSNNIISNSIVAGTMDTTSHDFNWQTFTFGGDGGSSYLKDVSIIDENNIWAVGEIYENGEKYNAVHWNGSEWELKKIMFYIDQDNTSAGKTPSESNTAFLFDNGHFAISSNVQIALFSTDSSYEIIKMGFLWEDRFTISAIWGISCSDFYVVGNNGNIAYYNGNNWRKIESRTELDIYDIWGDYNEATGEYEILAVAAKLLHSSDRDIIKITENQATILNENGIDWSLHGIWFKSNRKYFVVGSGIYKKNKLTEENWDTSLDLLTDYYTHSIRGTKLNDIIISGAYNEVLHYNGYSWQSYRGMINSSETGRLVKLDYKNNKCCIVGSNDGRAIIYVGKN